MKRVSEFCRLLIRIFLTGLVMGLTPQLRAAASTNDGDISEKLHSLSLKDKIGQLLMVGFYGTSIDESLRATIDKYHPGFVVTFSRNIHSGFQIATLNYVAQMQALKANGIPLLIAVDQEGGVVTRIKTRRPLPSAWAIGSTASTVISEQAGRGTGRLLHDLGFNMNLAPVLDLASRQKESFIGTRAFSDDPQTVARMSSAFAAGLRSEHILPTAKHFPGHGGVATDSHHVLPSKDKTLDELLAGDLVPYKSWIEDGRDSALMVAHISLPKIDPSEAPATFSSPIVNGLLRERLKYNGLVISDDLDMGGAASGGSVGERAVRALEAGVDVLMLAWNRKSQGDVDRAIQAAIHSGRLTEQRINQSVARVLNVKKIFASQRPVRPSYHLVDAALRDPRLAQIADQVAKANFRRQVSALDLEHFHLTSESRVVVVSFRGQFAKSLAEAHLFKKVLFTNPRTVNQNKLAAFVAAAEDRLVIATLDGRFSSEFINGLSNDVKHKTVVLNHDLPSAVTDPTEFAAVLNLGSFHPATGAWLAQVLTGAEPTAEPRVPADTNDQ